LPDAVRAAAAAGPDAAPAPGAVGPVARCRCPRCAYALTGLPGAPADAYGAFSETACCPECALEIPAGAHCLVGGTNAEVVDPSGSRSVLAIVLGAATLIGGPWLAILGAMFVLSTVQGSTLRRGIPMSVTQGWAIGALPALIGLGVGGYFAWRRWRRADGSSEERAGARMRRAMVVPGAVHLWSGEPASDAKPRSIAGGDIRDVRGRRHIPLFRRKGAGEAGAIDFVTPFALWAANYTNNTGNMANDGRHAGTMWLLMPGGQRPEALARALEKTIRRAPVAVPVEVESKMGAAVQTPLVDGNPNRLAVPAPITRGTPAEPATCPRCSHPLGIVPEGSWWEPLPHDVRCPECGLLAPAGAVVVSGFRNASGAQYRGGKGTVVLIAGIVVSSLLLVASIMLLATRVSTVLAVVVQVIATAGLPLSIVFGTRLMMRPVARPRARFQRSSETWVAEPGRLRIIGRGKRDAPETVVPVRGISRVTFGQQFAPDNSIPVVTEVLSVRGTARELGLVGERFLHVPLPAEVEEDAVIAALHAALGK